MPGGLFQVVEESRHLLYRHPFFPEHIDDLHRHPGIGAGQSERVLAFDEITFLSGYITCYDPEIPAVVIRVDEDAIDLSAEIVEPFLEKASVDLQSGEDGGADVIEDGHRRPFVFLDDLHHRRGRLLRDDAVPLNVADADFVYRTFLFGEFIDQFQFAAVAENGNIADFVRTVLADLVLDDLDIEPGQRSVQVDDFCQLPVDHAVEE